MEAQWFSRRKPASKNTAGSLECMSEQEAHEVVSGHEEVGKVNITLGISRQVKRQEE